jgi:hypothetical protein
MSNSHGFGVSLFCVKYSYILKQSTVVGYFIIDGPLFLEYVYPEQAGSAFLLKVSNYRLKDTT